MTGPPPTGPVDIAIPVNHLGRTKTRLLLPRQVREHLVIAFLIDTVQAALHSPAVRTVTVVTDDPVAEQAAWRAGAGSFSPELPHPGLNRDLTAFANTCGEQPLAVLLADLPALKPAELTAALTECAWHRAAFAADEHRSGTTLLYSERAQWLRPAFGDRSARRHHTAGAHPLSNVGPGLRRDVDTLPDLITARALGTGTHTTAEIHAHPDVFRSEVFLPHHRQLTDERHTAACPI